MSVSLREPMPVTVIGGYLGAGKTTLVNHLLRHANGLKLAVLVNDFGELPIDASLIESRDGNVINIAGGCICCSYGSELIAALQALAERNLRPDHVLLETSGVSLPGPIASSVTLLPGYTIDGIIVLADAETIREHSADRYIGDTIDRQLADADLVVLNKSDLVSPAASSATHGWIAEKTPHARMIAARQAALPLDIAIGSRLGFTPSDCHHSSVASQLFETRHFKNVITQSAAALAQAMTAPSLGIVRAKGFAREANGNQSVIQVVGRRATASAITDLKVDALGLVVIGLRGQLDWHQIEQLLGTSAGSAGSVAVSKGTPCASIIRN
jgi:G3E family GTPase